MSLYIIYTLSSNTLKNIRPDLNIALDRLTSSLLQIYVIIGREIQYIITTYILLIIVIIINAIRSKKYINTLLVRLRFTGNKVIGLIQDNKAVIKATNAQL
jgi:hypothetical protein